MSLLTQASICITPNGYKEGKLYSVIPSDGSGDMSVVRATTATRVNSAGLVELVPYNLIRRSEEFNLIWSPVRSSITANSTTAPDGTLTADTLIDDTNNNIHYIAQAFTAINGAATISVYAKANQISQIQLVASQGTTPMGRGFDLSTGTVFTESVGGVISNDLGQSITDVGNGWYRCEMSWTSTGQNEFWILLSVSNAATFTGTGANGIFIWGAQLVEGSTAKDYQKTETRLNIPRLDYSNGTCPSLLVEPQRTNLLTYSSSFDNADWVKVTSTITANSTTSPSGIQDADTLVATSDYGRIEKVVTYTDAPYTLSVFIKKSSVSQIFALAFSAIGGIDEFSVNINTGAIISQGANISMVACEDYGDYWRVIGTSTRVSGGSVSTRTVRIFGGYPININAVIWGAQLELGNYVSSYIPTTSASVTRNADVISKTGISSLIGQTEGTLFLDYLYTELDVNGNIPITIGLNGTNHAYIFFRNNGGVRFDFIVSGVATARIDTPASYSVKGTRYKMAFAYKDNDFAAYINGQLIGTDNAGAITGLSDLFLSYPYLSGYNPTSNINAAALWKTRLDNATLASLTTL
jgi:hypothetical protein